jgi:pimeloyl-ACP methyl ester carboxylesterase
LKTEELRDCADVSVDIACGLGQKVYVAGLSAGGTLSAWIVQNRAEVARAVLIAPALGFARHEGTRLQKALAVFLPMLPDIRTDWFSVDPDCPPHQYPGFSSRALGQLLRVSLATYAGALERPPRVQDVTLVTSQGDQAVNDFIAWQLMGLWRAKGLHALTCIDFPKAMNVPHDMIDPAQRGQQTQTVYPVLVQALNAP